MRCRWRLVLLIPALMSGAGFGLGADARAQSQARSESGLRLISPKQAQPLDAPAWESAGARFLSLKTAVAYFGGSVSWYPTSLKATVQGPTGRKAVLVPGYPKMVVEGRQLVRLPDAPKLHWSQILVTPETFQELWKAVGDREPVYSPEARVLRIGDTVVKPAAAAEPAPETDPGTKSKPVDERSAPAAAPKVAACIVVDAGHGGKDPGAIGPSRVEEKTVVLEIAIQLAAMLEKELGCKIILTRRDDHFIPLPERPEIANQAKANLFVSIHANASPDRKASGSQVFIYNREASSRKAAETARLENRDANYLEIIKDDLRQSVHEVDSITAAGLVSQEMEKDGMEARRIERAPFYVLAKSHMPSILVETAFISNREEENKLRRREFCRQIARDIFLGIKQYVVERSSPVAKNRAGEQQNSGAVE